MRLILFLLFLFFSIIAVAQSKSGYIISGGMGKVLSINVFNKDGFDFPHKAKGLVSYNIGAGYYFKKKNGGSFLQIFSNSSGHRLFYDKDKIATSNNYYIGVKFSRLWNHFFNPDAYDTKRPHPFYLGPIFSITFPLSQKPEIPAYTSSDRMFVIEPNSFDGEMRNSYDINVGIQAGFDCARIGIKKLMLKAELKSSIGYLYNWEYQYVYSNTMIDQMTIRNRNIHAAVEFIYFLK